MTPIAPPPPPAPAWPPTHAKPGRTILGIDAWMWFLAWVPLLPLAFFAIAEPAFVQPLFDERLRIAGLPPITLFLVLPAINLLAGRVNAVAGAIAVVLTTGIGVFATILGPAIVLILINLSTGPGQAAP